MPFTRAVGNYFDHSGSFIRRVAQWTGPAAYVTGGEDVSPAIFGMGSIAAILITSITDGTTIRIGAWNRATARLQWFVPNTNVEVANGVNLSTFTGCVEVIGN
jgi:hypothetical protein